MNHHDVITNSNKVFAALSLTGAAAFCLVCKFLPRPQDPSIDSDDPSDQFFSAHAHHSQLALQPASLKLTSKRHHWPQER